MTVSRVERIYVMAISPDNLEVIKLLGKNEQRMGENTSEIFNCLVIIKVIRILVLLF